MHEVLYKDTITSEILPYLPVAKRCYVSKCDLVEVIQCKFSTSWKWNVNGQLLRRFHDVADVGREEHSRQPLALARVSLHFFNFIAHARVCGTTAFCLVFGKNFNIMSALSVHQSPILPQIIDSREGLCWYKKGGGVCMWQNVFLFKGANICNYLWAIWC